METRPTVSSKVDPMASGASAKVVFAGAVSSR